MKIINLKYHLEFDKNSINNYYNFNIRFVNVRTLYKDPNEYMVYRINNHFLYIEQQLFINSFLDEYYYAIGYDEHIVVFNTRWDQIMDLFKNIVKNSTVQI